MTSKPQKQSKCTIFLRMREYTQKKSMKKQRKAKTCIALMWWDEMRSSSYTLLSRLRHTHRFNSRCQSQFLLFHYSDPKLKQNNDCSFSQNAPFSSSAHTLLRGLVSSSACSKRLVLLDLVSSGSVVHHQHQQQHLFHRSRSFWIFWEFVNFYWESGQ